MYQLILLFMNCCWPVVQALPDDDEEEEEEEEEDDEEDEGVVLDVPDDGSPAPELPLSSILMLGYCSWNLLLGDCEDARAATSCCCMPVYGSIMPGAVTEYLL